MSTMTRDEIIAAVRDGANLYGANLYGADLTGADLSRAILSGADLYKANLTGAALYEAVLYKANLSLANLYKADLSGARLSRAALSGASLHGANLFRADLTGAYLTGADLVLTDLTDASLTGTCLDPKAPMPAVSDEELIAAGFVLRGGRVYGWRTARSQHAGSTVYEPGQTYRAPWFSVDTSTDCHPGIYLAGRLWLQENYPDVPLVRVSCARKDILKAVDKFRAKEIRVLKSN